MSLGLKTIFGTFLVFLLGCASVVEPSKVVSETVSAPVVRSGTADVVGVSPERHVENNSATVKKPQKKSQVVPARQLESLKPVADSQEPKESLTPSETKSSPPQPGPSQSTSALAEVAIVPATAAPIAPSNPTATSNQGNLPSEGAVQNSSVADSNANSLESAADLSADRIAVPSPTGNPPAVTKASVPVPGYSSVETASAVKALEKKLFTGQMRIKFSSRDTNRSKSDPDVYRANLQLGEELKISGLVTRKQREFGGILGRETQPMQLEYNLLFESNSSVTKPLARLLGNVQVSASGLYSFIGSGEGLKFEFVNNRSNTAGASSFAGNVQGKQEVAEIGLSNKLRSYSRLIGGRKVVVSTKTVDPLQFKDLLLASGPDLLDPACRVNGRLDYDYETGNWFADNLRFSYQTLGAVKTDVMSGSIRWLEDPQRVINGRGKYEFNLRLNEHAAQSEASFFEKLPDEEAFFAVDDDLPGIYGSISYVDTFANTGDSTPAVLASAVDYQLEFRGLTRVQIDNFLKLWFIAIGPMNDE